MRGVIHAWGRLLAGRLPVLSVEITRECPLTCPGCYAYAPNHLGGSIELRELGDYRGDELVARFFRLVDEHRPLHVSIVGGEPLVRYRELSEILPRLSSLGIYTQVVTSAVRRIPAEWRGLPRLELSVSIDGLQPEHDERRKPATYERILKHIADHQVTVHCTVTRQQVRRAGYLDEFVGFWSTQNAVRKILVSLYTPQLGEISDERLSAVDRSQVVNDLLDLRTRFPKLAMSAAMIRNYLDPPQSPAECTFARTTTCVSADLEKRISPCQLGGRPDCANCGCVAAAGLEAVARHRLPGGVRVGALLDGSDARPRVPLVVQAVGCGDGCPRAPVRVPRSPRSRRAEARLPAGDRRHEAGTPGLTQRVALTSSTSASIVAASWRA